MSRAYFGRALNRSVSSVVAGAALILAGCALFVAYLWAVGLGLGGN